MLYAAARRSRRRQGRAATRQRVEAWLLRRALEAEGGCRAATARRLGLTREGLYKVETNSAAESKPVKPFVGAFGFEEPGMRQEICIADGRRGGQQRRPAGSAVSAAARARRSRPAGRRVRARVPRDAGGVVTRGVARVRTGVPGLEGGHRRARRARRAAHRVAENGSPAPAPVVLGSRLAILLDAHVGGGARSRSLHGIVAMAPRTPHQRSVTMTPEGEKA